MVQVFLSHTKLDKDYCDRFDSVAVREGLKVFRSEFEEIGIPAWKTIKEEINNSLALFLLVGGELVKAQESSVSDRNAQEDWKHTQNWISYEVGLACQRGIDVWVVCDSVNINFPVPYLNNYAIWGISRDIPQDLKFWRGIFRGIASNFACPVGKVPEKVFTCSHCGAVFNLHSVVPARMEILCPTCLKYIAFEKGFLLSEI
jgi:hypothetical protein